MAFTTSESWLTPRLVNALYTEAMLLADESRAYFDMGGAADRDALSPLPRVLFSCEAMRVTTRLMHIVAWLLTRRAIEAGELRGSVSGDRGRRLGRAQDSDPAGYAMLPAPARALIDASRELYQRVARLDGELDSGGIAPSPAHGLLSRLERAF